MIVKIVGFLEFLVLLANHWQGYFDECPRTFVSARAAGDHLLRHEISISGRGRSWIAEGRKVAGDPAVLAGFVFRGTFVKEYVIRCTDNY